MRTGTEPVAIDVPEDFEAFWHRERAAVVAFGAALTGDWAAAEGDWSADVQTERATVRLTGHITGGAEVGDFLYVVTTPIPGVSTRLVRVDANGHVLSRDLLVGLPGPVAFARGSVWIGDRGRNSVLRVDLASLRTAEAKLFAPANPSVATPVAPDGTPGPVANLPVSPTQLAVLTDPIVAGKTADGRWHLLSIDAAGRSAREIFSSDNEFAIAPDSRGTLFVLDGSQLFAWKPLRGGSWSMPGGWIVPDGLRRTTDARADAHNVWLRNGRTFWRFDQTTHAFTRAARSTPT